MICSLEESFAAGELPAAVEVDLAGWSVSVVDEGGPCRHYRFPSVVCLRMDANRITRRFYVRFVILVPEINHRYVVPRLYIC